MPPLQFTSRGLRLGAVALGAPLSEAEAGAPAARAAQLVTVQADASVATTQRLTRFVGISRATAQAEAISMNLVVIPPGAVAEPHVHLGFETAIYVLEGKVETRYGPHLAQSMVNHAGDFLFIPPNVPHQPRNLSATRPARAIVARTLADERETVVPYVAEVAP